MQVEARGCVCVQTPHEKPTLKKRRTFLARLLNPRLSEREWCSFSFSSTDMAGSEEDTVV